MNVAEYCIEIFRLLESVEENTWGKQFEYFISQFKIANDKELCRKIFEVYKGAGSFNDLVLYKDGKLCYNENEALNLLRRNLFDELKKCLYD